MRYQMCGLLPDVLKFEGGSYVNSASDWRRRREEIEEEAVRLCYGGMPPQPEAMEVQALSIAMPGTPSVYRIVTGTREKQLSIYFKIYRPNREGRVPVVLDGDGCFTTVSSEVIQMFNAHGIAVAVFDRSEIVRDIWQDPEPRNCALYHVYPEIESGTIAGWAWGYCRCIDALFTLDYIDVDHIAVTGHSRGGKAAMLAGAVDERVAFVSANASGAGGAGCWRFVTHEPEEWQISPGAPFTRGERLGDTMKLFPNWLGAEMKCYIDNEEKIPFDQHFFKAMIAPRWLIQTEAVSDIWANPKGTYITHCAAKKVYEQLGEEGKILLHYRPGHHDHCLSDFALLLNVMLHELSGVPLNEEFFYSPFSGSEGSY